MKFIIHKVREEKNKKKKKKHIKQLEKRGKKLNHLQTLELYKKLLSFDDSTNNRWEKKSKE